MPTALVPEPKARAKFENGICLLLLGALLGIGIGSFAASFLPFSLLEANARSMSARGEVQFFNQGFYHDMQIRLRIFGIANLALAAVGFSVLRRIYSVAEQFSRDLARWLEDLRANSKSVPLADKVTLLTLTAAAAVLRFPLLFQPMRGDEAYSFLTYASHPFYVGLSFYNDTNNHLFNTFLMRLSFLVFGNQPWALRLPVFFAGICMVPAAYFASRSLYERTSALLAPALVAASSPLIEYSTNARGYVLLCLECLLLIPIGAHALRQRNFAAWGLFAAVSAIGFYTMPIMLYPFGGIVAWLVLSIFLDPSKSKARAIVPLAVAVMLAGIASLELYAPVFAISGPHAVFGKKLAAPKPLQEFVYEMPGALASTWEAWNRDIPVWVTAIQLCGFAIALIFQRRVSSERVSFPVAMLVWLVPLLLAHRVVPFARVWLFALPFYLIVASAGLIATMTPVFAKLHVRHGMVALAILACLFLGLQEKRSGSVYLANEGRGMEDIALTLKGQLKPGDSVVAVVPSDTLLLYHFKRNAIPTSYLNAPIAGRALVVVDEHEGDTLESVLQTADRTTLQGEPHRLLAKYETASLYEVTLLAQP